MFTGIPAVKPHGARNVCVKRVDRRVTAGKYRYGLYLADIRWSCAESNRVYPQPETHAVALLRMRAFQSAPRNENSSSRNEKSSPRYEKSPGVGRGFHQISDTPVQSNSKVPENRANLNPPPRRVVTPPKAPTPAPPTPSTDAQHSPTDATPPNPANEHHTPNTPRTSPHTSPR